MGVDAKKFATELVDSWNSHDMDRIMSDYSDDIEIITPMIKVVLGTEEEILKGKGAVRRYWEAIFKKMPDMQLELKEVSASIESVAIHYRSVHGKRAVGIISLDGNGKVNRIIAHYE